MRPEPNHVHIGTILEWHDGDTVKIDGDLDYETHNQGWHRLIGVDTPELPTKEGFAAKDWVQAHCPVGTQVIYTSYKNKRAIPTGGAKEKYGRWLACIWVGDDDISINERLIEAGHAKPYWGEKK